MLGFVVYSGPICNAITVSGISKCEYLSVPTQQLMRVYKEKEDELSSEDKQMIEDLFHEAAFEYYNPKISDGVKGLMNTDFMNSHMSEYLHLWLRLGVQYPQTYADSFYLNTDGYWYPFTEMFLSIDGTKGYLSLECRPPAVPNPRIPFLYNIIMNFDDGDIVQGNNLVSWIFAPATYFYLLLLTLAYLLWKREYKRLVTLMFAALLWVTFLPGPVVLVRYSIYLFYLVPIEIFCLKNIEKQTLAREVYAENH